jgi:hypothetical protein
MTATHEVVRSTFTVAHFSRVDAPNETSPFPKKKKASSLPITKILVAVLFVYEGLDDESRKKERF